MAKAKAKAKKATRKRSSVRKAPPKPGRSPRGRRAASKEKSSAVIRISKPGIYPGVNAVTYHLDPVIEPSLSASLIKIIAKKSVAHAVVAHPRLNPNYKPLTPTSDMDFGTACHAAMLGSPPITIIPASDFRTDRARHARRVIREMQGAFVLQPDVPIVQAMRDKLKAELPDDLRAAMFDSRGLSEVIAVWKEDGVWFRARADRWIEPGMSTKWPRGLIVDYKTTFDAAAEEWTRTVFNTGADFQSTLYPHGFCLAWNQSNAGPAMTALPDFRYIVQETTPPFEFSILAPSEMTRLHVETKIVRAFDAWKKSAADRQAAGYPRETAYFDPPPWELNREDRASLAAQVLSQPL